MMHPFSLTFVIGTEILLSTSVERWELAWPTLLTKPLQLTQHTLLPLKNMTFTATMLQALLVRVSHTFGQPQARKPTG